MISDLEDLVFDEPPSDQDASAVLPEVPLQPAGANAENQDDDLDDTFVEPVKVENVAPPPKKRKNPPKKFPKAAKGNIVLHFFTHIFT